MSAEQKVQQLIEQFNERFAEKSTEQSVAELRKCVDEIQRAAAEQRASSVTSTAQKPAVKSVSLTRVIRGIAAMEGRPINGATRAEDLKYAEKALTTGSEPGSFLVPEIQADETIEMLGKGGALRAARPTIWPMLGIDTLRVPVEADAPVVEYLTQNTEQDESDPDLDKLTLTLKTRRTLVGLPNELLQTSSPAVDGIVERMLVKGFARHEDYAFFIGLAGGPTPLLNMSGYSTVPWGLGGYDNLLAILEKSDSVEAEGPFVWFMTPRSFYRRILNITDGDGRFVVQAQAADNGVRFLLFGEPVIITTRMPDSVIVRTNPRYIHIGDGAQLEIQASTHAAFKSNKTLIRGVHRHDFGIGPAAGVVIVTGVEN